MKFSVIVADPPWSFNDKLKMSATKRGAESNYDTMTTKQICDIRVDLISADNSVLFLWVPGTLLKDGLQVLESWGFVYNNFYCWGKKTKNNLIHFGMGHTFRSSCELALIGKKGKIKCFNHSCRNLDVDEFDSLYDEDVALKHSKKTEKLQDKLELMFGGNKIELFARRRRESWLCVGYEITGNDVNDDISKIIEGK